MKNAKKYLILIFCILVAHHANAQKLGGGFEVGISTTALKIKDIKDSLISNVEGNNFFGIEGGVFLKISAGPVYAKPKLLLSYQRGTVDFIADSEKQNVTVSGGKILVPVLFGLKLSDLLSIEAGPVYNRIISLTKDFNGHQIEVKPDGLGYRVGVSVALNQLFLTASYQGIKNGSSSSLSSFETPSQFILSAGIDFGGE